MRPRFKIVRSTNSAVYAFDTSNSKIHQIQGVANLSDGELTSVLASALPSHVDIAEHPAPDSTFRPAILERLTLVLLNKCNIKCDYCYEDAGTFGLSYTRMSADLAKTTIDEVYKAYDSVSFLMFFGGEPLLMARHFSVICDYVLEVCRNKGVSPPQFGLITNAILVTDKIVDLLKQYNMSVTVSLDGPEPVHDTFRKTKGGTGTFQQAKKGYEKLLSSGVPTYIQSTLDEEHAEVSDVPSIIRYLNDELHAETPHVTVAGVFGDPAVKPRIKSGMVDACQEYVESIVSGNSKFGFSLAESILGALVNPRTSEFTCPAGFEIAVSPTGDVYPCFMFVGKDEFRIGSVLDGIDQNYWDKLTNFMKRSLKVNRFDCSNCWASNLCSSCMGNNFNCAGSADLNPDFHCDVIRSCSKELISLIGDIRSDDVLWGKFVQNFSRRDAAPTC